MNRMANVCGAATELWESAGNAADFAFSQATAGAGSLAQVTEQATSATDCFMAALGNYDKSALEAVCTAEELINLGFKTEESLSAAAAAAEEQLDAIEKGTIITKSNS